MSILKWNLSFALFFLKRTNYLKEFWILWKRCREGTVNEFPRFLQFCFWKLLCGYRHFLQIWSGAGQQGKGEKEGIKSTEIANQIWSPAFQTTLFPRFPPFPLSPHFLFRFFFSFCLLQALLKKNAKTTFVLIFSYVRFWILFREPDWFCNHTFWAGVAYFRPVAS